MARGRKGSTIQSKLAMILYGEQFTGKSTMAMQLAYFKRPDGKPFRVLYLDPESGSIDDYLPDLEADGINLENIYIVYTQSLGEVREYISKVRNNEDLYILDNDGNETDDIVTDADGNPFRADAIVIDGTTILNLTTKQGLIEFSKKRNTVKADKDGLLGDARLVKIEGAGLELKDYSTVNFKGQDLILDLMASGVHFICTARETDEKQTVKTDDGKITSIATGRKKPDGFKDMGYNAKTVIRMFRNEDGTICAHVEKDRTHTHEDNSIVEDPTLLDWQSVIDKNAKLPSFTVNNDMTKAVQIEQDIYTKEILGGNEKSVAQSTEVDNSNDENTADSLRKQIVTKKNALSPMDKKALKEKLELNNLPTAFKNVTDIEVLNKVLKLFD